MLRTPRRSGFTLVESFVVVTIIGMLMALPVPGFKAARIRAQRNAVQNVLIDFELFVQRSHDDLRKYPTMKEFEAPTGDARRYLERYQAEHEGFPLYWDYDAKTFRVDYEFDFVCVIKDVVLDHDTYDSCTLCAEPVSPYSDGMFEECVTIHVERFMGQDVKWKDEYVATFLSEATLLEMEATRMTNYRALLSIARTGAADPENAQYFWDAMQTPQVQELAWNALNLIKEDESSGRPEVISVGELRLLAQPQPTDTLMIAEVRSAVDDILTIQGLNDGRYDDLSVPLDELRLQPVDPSALRDTETIDLLMTGMFSNAGVQDSVLRKFDVAQRARERGDLVVADHAMQATRFELWAQEGKSILAEDVELLFPVTWLASPSPLPE